MKETLKKLMLAGIGGAAFTAEKSKDFFEEMVKKGHLTVEQGKILNEELKHSMKAADEVTEEKDEDTEEKSFESILKSLPVEDRKKLKEMLENMEEDEK